MPSHYDTLGVPHSAEAQAITRAFRRLAREHHPDTHPDDPGAEERFKAITAAYEVLRDPARRAEYDAQQRMTGTAGAWGPYAAPADAATDWGDVFSAVMGGFAAAAQALRGEDIEARVTVSFHEALHGTHRTLTLVTPQECPACARGGHSGVCAACAGTGVVRTEHAVRVTVPPGARTGTRVRLPGRGAPGYGGGRAGDLYVVVSVEPDPVFTREGDDVRIEHSLHLDEAALGCQITVPTPWGTSVKVTVPAGTQPGHTLRVPGQGAPRLGGSGRGALHITLRVKIPRRLSHAARTALEALRAQRDPHSATGGTHSSG